VLSFVRSNEKEFDCNTLEQGDQIGRIFAILKYVGDFLSISPKIFATYFTAKVALISLQQGYPL
jgi:hypothetical protein